MKNTFLYTLFFALLLLVGCDYNDKHFDGYDDVDIADLVQYEGEFTGGYPEAGYFTDKPTLETALNDMLQKIFLYCDKGSTARISVLFGDITPGIGSVDESYVLTGDDYRSMGESQGQPGRYNNFDANMDIDMYLSVFLKLQSPYTSAGKTKKVTYLYYADRVTSEQSRIYRYDGNNWSPFDPYAESIEVTTKQAEMTFDGTNWILNRLMGGSFKHILGKEDYFLLLEWVKENKPEYLSKQSDNEEFYFGSSPQYGNMNNNYDTWRNLYNINGEYTGYSNEQMQQVMDERMAEGIARVILPVIITEPDDGLSYAITYTVYQGRGSGNYTMSFLYDEEDGFEWIGGPVK